MILGNCDTDTDTGGLRSRQAVAARRASERRAGEVPRLRQVRGVRACGQEGETTMDAPGLSHPGVRELVRMSEGTR